MLKQFKKIFLNYLHSQGYHVFHNSVMPPTGNHQRLIRALGQRGLDCSFILDVGALFGGWTEWAYETFPQA